MRVQSPNRPPFTTQGPMINNYSVVSNLEKLEAGSNPPTIIPQNSSPLRNSTGMHPLYNIQKENHLGSGTVSGHSTRLQVRDSVATAGGARVGHSPLRQGSHSKSPGGRSATSYATTLAHHQARGVRPNIEREQYTTLNDQRSSPLRQSMTPNPLTELNNESVLRQRRAAGYPTEEEVTGNQAATIMTSVSESFLPASICFLVLKTVASCLSSEHDQVELGPAEEQVGFDEAR